MLVQAQYWHDPLAQEEFEAKSLYLADINNEGPLKNTTYRDNLAALDNLVLVRFTEDTIVDPKESEWFGWFSPVDHSTLLSLRDTKMYMDDWIGLKSLDESGKLHLLSVEVGN